MERLTRLMGTLTRWGLGLCALLLILLALFRVLAAQAGYSLIERRA